MFRYTLLLTQVPELRFHLLHIYIYIPGKLLVAFFVDAARCSSNFICTPNKDLWRGGAMPGVRGRPVGVSAVFRPSRTPAPLVISHGADVSNENN